MTIKNTSRKITKLIAAALAAMTMMTTAAAFSASASDTKAVAEMNTTAAVTAMDTKAEDIISKLDLPKDLDSAAELFMKVMADPAAAFPEGTDKAEVTGETESAVPDKIREYLGDLFEATVKTGLEACCGSMTEGFDGMLNDMIDYIFDIKKDTTNKEVISRIDEQTEQLKAAIKDTKVRRLLQVCNSPFFGISASR